MQELLSLYARLVNVKHLIVANIERTRVFLYFFFFFLYMIGSDKEHSEGNCSSEEDRDLQGFRQSREPPSFYDEELDEQDAQWVSSHLRKNLFIIMLYLPKEILAKL